MRYKLTGFVLSGLLIIKTSGFSQQEYYPFETSHFHFIDYGKNRFTLFDDSSSFSGFYKKFDSLLQYGTGQLKIVHIGGSHIQADIYTHRIRQRFNEFEPGILGYRGFIFPYRLAQSNNPVNYRVEYSGTWTFCKSTQREMNCLLGLAGYSVSTSDTLASLKIFLNQDSTMHFDYNRLKIFHPYTGKDYQVEVLTSENCVAQIRNQRLGYTEYYFAEFQDSIELIICRTDTLQHQFVLHGLSFESDDPGITYNTIGVNGAKLESFLRCQLLGNHLEALKPDLVIISIGTNDGNTRKFDADLYRHEYMELLTHIRKSAPDAAILLTVPNDSYLFKRYINRNTEKMMNIIIDLARNNNYAVWDFYSIMGGLNSARAWYDASLMNPDHIHFNKQGYMLKGDLFFAAFLNTWEGFLK
ncbi:MAG TPA: GDSL-type esterase/lipase family protein [Bacteroidales bacterium]|nr:GDSL-type esterase/lipase family protein [Bacteroidales bacterium]